MDKKFWTLSRAVLTALCVTLAVLLALMIAVTAYAGFFSKTAQPVITETAQKPTESTVPAVVVTALKEEKEPQSNIVNLLLVGKDADGATGTRSDTMILCTFNKKDQTITMTSFLRDLYVKIPGHGKDRINAAYNFGGMELLKQTISENFDVRIDGSIQVDFECFERIVDLLGGVTLELTAAEASYINRRVQGSALTEGAQLLTGRQALTYARNRRDKDGDFSRTHRQRKLLAEMIKAYKDQKMTRMLGIMKEVVPMVKTDISKTDMTVYAMTLFPMLSSAEVRTRAIPVAGGYHDERIDGKAVLVPDLEKNRKALEDTAE